MALEQIVKDKNPDGTAQVGLAVVRSLQINFRHQSAEAEIAAFRDVL